MSHCDLCIIHILKTYKKNVRNGMNKIISSYLFDKINRLVIIVDHLKTNKKTYPFGASASVFTLQEASEIRRMQSIAACFHYKIIHDFSDL